MNKLLIAIFCLNINVSYALTLKEFNQDHLKKQQNLFASLDYCSNIGSQQIFNLGAMNLSNIKSKLIGFKFFSNIFRDIFFFLT